MLSDLMIFAELNGENGRTNKRWQLECLLGEPDKSGAIQGSLVDTSDVEDLSAYKGLYAIVESRRHRLTDLDSMGIFKLIPE